MTDVAAKLLDSGPAAPGEATRSVVDKVCPMETPT